jgi:hypothetical protein
LQAKLKKYAFQRNFKSHNIWHSLEKNNLAKEYKPNRLHKEWNAMTLTFQVNQHILISVFSMKKNHPVKNQGRITQIRIVDQ